MRRLTILVWALIPALVCGCSATRRSGMPIEESGFLSDYSLLSHTDDAIPGDFGPRPELRYINPNADWNRYKKILIDPIVFFRSADIEPPPEAQTLLNYAYAELREVLGRDYEIVDSLGPGTMRITIAFTRFGARNVTMDTISTWVPFGRALAEIQGLTFGKPSFVGYAKVEIKVTDAETGELVYAALDKRVGGKTLKDFDSWSDVRAAMDFWAELARFRFCLVRGGTDCVPPGG